VQHISAPAGGGLQQRRDSVQRPAQQQRQLQQVQAVQPVLQQAVQWQRQ
jgi:hypothetical protein